MINIKKSSKVITIAGHANYSEAGNDIVCASISSIMYTSINAILRFNSEAISYNDDKHVVTITQISDDEITTNLILNMMQLFTDLASQYPKNIKIESEE